MSDTKLHLSGARQLAQENLALQEQVKILKQQNSKLTRERDVFKAEVKSIAEEYLCDGGESLDDIRDYIENITDELCEANSELEAVATARDTAVQTNLENFAGYVKSQEEIKRLKDEIKILHRDNKVAEKSSMDNLTAWDKADKEIKRLKDENAELKAKHISQGKTIMKYKANETPNSELNNCASVCEVMSSIHQDEYKSLQTKMSEQNTHHQKIIQRLHRGVKKLETENAELIEQLECLKSTTDSQIGELEEEVKHLGDVD